MKNVALILLAAIALAEKGVPETETEGKRKVAAVARIVGDKLGNTPAVARASYISPAVIEQYLDGRTIDDFRPRHLRVVGARDTGLDREERALAAQHRREDGLIADFSKPQPVCVKADE